MSDIDEYRREIDQLNREIRDRLKRRFQLSEKIGRYKRQHGLPVLDPSREKAILKEYEEDGKHVQRIFEKIMEESRAYQKERFDSSQEEDSMEILVINGPNMNMLGLREPEIYGNSTYSSLVRQIEDKAGSIGVKVQCFQSNHEGDIVDRIQQAYGHVDGIVINPAAYTHTSLAIADALRAVSIPAVEVHISKVSDREDFRQISYIRDLCIDTIEGEGFAGYLTAMDILKERDVDVEKKALRMKVRINLNGIEHNNPGYRSEASIAIGDRIESMTEYVKADTVLLYAGTERETDTEKIIRDALKAGKNVCLPKCTGEGIMDAYRIESMDDLLPGKYGILEPVESCKMVEPGEIDFIMVPCATCNQQGYRLGYGGGYYDRYLEKTEAFTVVGIRELLIEDHIPIGKFDVPVKAVVTEHRLIRVK